MLHIEARGDGVFALLDQDGRLVGGIRGTSIRVGAFATQDDAIDAALRGDVVTDGYLRGAPARRPAGETAHVLGSLAAHGERTGRDRRLRAARMPVARHETALVHDGAYEWIVLRGRPVARLIRPGAPTLSAVAAVAAPISRHECASARGDDGRRYSLEFVLPDAVPVSTRLTIARAIVETIQSPALRPPTHTTVVRTECSSSRATEGGSA